MFSSNPSYDAFIDDDGIYPLSNDVDETLNLSYVYLPLIQISTMFLYYLQWLGDIKYGRKVKEQKRRCQPFHEKIGSKLSDYIFRRIYEMTRASFNKLHDVPVPFEQILCYIHLRFCNSSLLDYAFELIVLPVRVGESSGHGPQHWEVRRKDSVVSNIAKIIFFDAKTRCVDETVLVDWRLFHTDVLLMLPPRASSRPVLLLPRMRMASLYQEEGMSCLVDAGWRGVWNTYFSPWKEWCPVQRSPKVVGDECARSMNCQKEEVWRGRRLGERVVLRRCCKWGADGVIRCLFPVP